MDSQNSPCLLVPHRPERHALFFLCFYHLISLLRLGQPATYPKNFSDILHDLILIVWISHLIKSHGHPVTKPSQLALGETTGILLELVYGLFKAHLTFKVGEKFLVADTLAGLTGRSLFIQPAGFF